MNAEAIRTLYEYHFALNRRVWDECIMTLSEGQFTQDSDYSIGSLQEQVIHMIRVDARWFARLQHKPLPEILPADYPTRDALHSLLDQVETDMREYLAALDDATLNQIFEYDMPHRGGIKRDPIWMILVHVVTHGVDHRAQVLALLHQLDAPTIEQDLILYHWAKQP